jgi:hypothetical protein
MQVDGQEAQVTDDDLAGMTPEAIQNIVNTRLGTGPAAAPSSPAGQEQGSEAVGAGLEPGAGSAPSSASQDPNLRQSDETPPADADGAADDGDDGDDGGDEDDVEQGEDFVPPNLDQSDDGDDELIQVGDRRIPRRFIEAYEQFDAAFQTDPGLRALVQAYMQTGNVPPELVGGGGQQQQPYQQPQNQQPAAQQRTEPPADLDLDDPATRTLWEAHVATQQRLDAITSHLQTAQQQTQAEQMGRSQSLVNRAVESFREQHGMTQEEIQRLCGIVQRTNLIETFMRNPDPVNGTPGRPDPLRAVENALDVMYHYVPEFRNKDAAATEERRRAAAKKKQKLSSLSPRSGGSASRKTPAPTDEAGRRDAMKAEVAEMMAGTWSG